MQKIKIFTTGVYGTTKESFFNTLIENGIDTFCDIRRRRAVRGSEYTYANSKRLQSNLAKMKINYLHLPDLSPTDEIRKLQYEIDKELGLSQRKRESLSGEFITRYKKEILDKFDFEGFISLLNTLKSKRVVLFCVEKNASACHRSILADYLHQNFGLAIKHL